MLCASVCSAPIQVNWDSNTVNTEFIIERSVNGLPFMEIGRVDSSEGKFVDNNVVPLTLYRYRIKAIINGTVMYSDIEEGVSAVE